MPDGIQSALRDARLRDSLAKALYDVPTPDNVRESNGIHAPAIMPFDALYMNGFGTDMIYFQRLADAAIEWMGQNNVI